MCRLSSTISCAPVSPGSKRCFEGPDFSVSPWLIINHRDTETQRKSWSLMGNANKTVLLLASLLLFVSVFLLIRAGYPIVRNAFEARAQKDMARFEAWSQELFLHWSPQKLRYAAYAAN